MKRILPGAGYDVYETADGVSLVIDGTAFSIEQTHPFKVQNAKFPTSGSTVNLKVFVGQVFGKGPNQDLDQARDGKAWSVYEDNIRVRIGSTLTPVAGSVTYDSAYLDERNIGMTYNGTLDTLHDNVLYVEIKSESDSPTGFEARLHLKSVMDAKADYDAGVPRTDFIEGKDELKTENVWHDSPVAPTNPFEVLDVQFGNGAGNLSLTQKWNLYKNTHQRVGVYQVPVAYIRKVDDKWTVRQVLRSDIFFPYGLNTTTYYIGSHVDDFHGTCEV